MWNCTREGQIKGHSFQEGTARLSDGGKLKLYI